MTFWWVIENYDCQYNNVTQTNDLSNLSLNTVNGK